MSIPFGVQWLVWAIAVFGFNFALVTVWRLSSGRRMPGAVILPLVVLELLIGAIAHLDLWVLDNSILQNVCSRYAMRPDVMEQITNFRNPMLGLGLAAALFALSQIMPWSRQLTEWRQFRATHCRCGYSKEGVSICPECGRVHHPLPTSPARA